MMLPRDEGTYEMLSGEDAEESGLASAVHADKKSTRAGRERGRDVKENRLFSVVVVVEHVNQNSRLGRFHVHIRNSRRSSHCIQYRDVLDVMVMMRKSGGGGKGWEKWVGFCCGVGLTSAWSKMRTGRSFSPHSRPLQPNVWIVGLWDCAKES